MTTPSGLGNMHLLHTRKGLNPGCAIVKLGGSVITLKQGGLDSANLNSVVAEMAEHSNRLVVVHGCGSFTRSLIIRHKLESDFLASEQRALVEELRRSARNLNRYVTTACEGAGLRCAPVIPHEIMRSSGGEVLDGDLALIGEHLERGITPVLHGDVLADDEQGYYACSSDRIVSHLAAALKPKAVIFVTDVDGVYERFPPESDEVQPLKAVDATILARMPHDYKVGYGDMHGKVVQAIACVPFTDFCCIVNGRVPGNLSAALESRILSGTRVVS
jgi:isopentenyl phosphate kinase